MVPMEKRYQYLKPLIVDTISLMLKNDIKYEKSFKVDGIVGVTIDDKSVMLLKLDKLIEAQVTKTGRKSVKRTAEVSEEDFISDEDYDDEEIIRQFVKVEEPKCRKRTGDFLPAQSPPKRTKRKYTRRSKPIVKDEMEPNATEKESEAVDEVEGEKSQPSSQDVAEAQGSQDEAENVFEESFPADDDIKVEEDGSFFIGDLYYVRSKAGRGYHCLYKGYRYYIEKHNIKHTHWCCAKHRKGCKARLTTFHTLGTRAPGRLKCTIGTHTHPPSDDDLVTKPDATHTDDFEAPETKAEYDTEVQQDEEWVEEEYVSPEKLSDDKHYRRIVDKGDKAVKIVYYD